MRKLSTLFLVVVSLAHTPALADTVEGELPKPPAETSTTVILAPEQKAETDAKAKAKVQLPSTKLNTVGFYPLWENTGYVQPENELYVSTIGVHYGFENQGHVGVMPLSYLYRTPNLYVKHKLLDDPDRRWTLAVQANLYYVLRGGARSLFSPVYTSRLDNSDFGFGMIPVALSGTYAVKSWWLLHGTLTEMAIFGGGLNSGLETGLSVVSEFRAFDSQSLLLHLGEVGFWNHDFWYTGVSYRYRGDWFEFRLGYFYRTFALGSQSGPMMGLGIVL